MSITIHAHLVRRQTTIGDLDTEEAYSIEVFKKKAILLRDAKEQQNSILISKSTFSPSGECIAFEASNPDWQQIESLATRFRFFFGGDEPTHAQKFLNFLYKKSEDEWAKNYIAKIRHQYNSFLEFSFNPTKTSHPPKNKEIIDLWFNSEIFHSEKNKRIKLDLLNGKIGEEASIYQLNAVIRLLECQISAIYHIIHKTCPDHLFIYTPNHHFKNLGTDRVFIGA